MFPSNGRSARVGYASDMATSSDSVRIHRINGLAAYCYLIETPDALFLVDAGMLGAGRGILRSIERLGRRPEELRVAFVTHAHPDHFGGLGVVQRASSCQVVCHPAHADTLRSGALAISPGRNLAGVAYNAFARLVMPAIALPRLDNVTPLDDGARLDVYGLAGRILHTPGHSTGDLTVLLDDGSAFVGDIVQGRRIPGLSPPEFSIMALDEAEILRSWQRLLESGAQTIYPAHGTPVGIDDVRAVFERKIRS